MTRACLRTVKNMLKSIVLGALMLGMAATTVSSQSKDVVDTAVANGSFKT